MFYSWCETFSFILYYQNLNKPFSQKLQFIFLVYKIYWVAKMFIFLVNQIYWVAKMLLLHRITFLILYMNYSDSMEKRILSFENLLKDLINYLQYHEKYHSLYRQTKLISICSWPHYIWSFIDMTIRHDQSHIYFNLWVTVTVINPFNLFSLSIFMVRWLWKSGWFSPFNT